MLVAASRRHALCRRATTFSRLTKAVRLETGIRTVDTFENKLRRCFGECDRTTRRSVSTYKRAEKDEARNDGGSNLPESEELSLKEKFKITWKRYGVVAIGTYSCIYFTTLGVSFCIYDFGLLTTADLPAAITEGMSVHNYVDELPDWLHDITDTLEENPRMKTMGLAWMTTELMEPLRILGTLLLTPRIARVLGRVPPKSK